MSKRLSEKRIARERAVYGGGKFLELLNEAPEKRSVRESAVGEGILGVALWSGRGRERLGRVACVAGGVFVLVLWGMLVGGCREQSAKGEPAPRPVPVEVERIVWTRAQRTLRLTGSVRAGREVQIRAQVAGQVLRRTFELGDRVRRGQTLVVLDGTLYHSMIQKNQGTVSRVKASIRRTQALRNMTRRSFRRLRRLHRAKGASTAQLDNIRSRLHQADAALHEAQASQSEAQAALRIARWRYRQTRIRAPFAGTITRRFVEKGGYLGPGTPVAEVALLHPAQVMVGISALDLPHLNRKESVTIEIDAFPQRPVRGRIVRVGHKADPYSRAYPVEIHFNNTKRDIRPGMVARVILRLGRPQKRILVPTSALLRRFDQQTVFVVKEGRARRLQVQPGRLYDNRIVIKKGLRPGDQLIVVGQHNLTPGRAVHIVRRAAKP